MSMLPADTHRRLGARPRLVAASEVALAAVLPVRAWEFDPGDEPERCTCAGADSLCEACLAMRDLFEEWATERRLLDASAWIAYQRAWPEAMTGRHLHVRGWQQPRVIEYARPQALEWEDAVLPDLLAASEAAEPSGEEP